MRYKISPFSNRGTNLDYGDASMTKIKYAKHAFGSAIVVMLFLLSGCASTTSQVKQRYFWPPPPDQPRIEWIGAYSSDNDLHPPTLLSKITGEGGELYLQRPLTAVSNSNGKVYVASAEAVSIYVFDFTKHDVFKLGGSNFAGVMKTVNGIAVDDKGYVYAADSSAKKIYVFDQISNSLVKTLDVSKYVKSIGKLAINKKAGRIVIPDISGDQIVVTDLEGKYVFSFGKNGSEDGAFNSPVAVAIEADGGIVVCDSRNARIQRFSPEGKFVGKFGRRGDSGGDFSIIKGVAIDSEGHIYVTDGKENRVTIFTQQGEYLLTFGDAKTQKPGEPIVAGGFLVPQGIDIDQNDRIYVADQLNARFQVFQYLNSSYLKQFPVLPGQAAVPEKPARPAVK